MNPLFPVITKFDLTEGRKRAAGRKQRIKNYMKTDEYKNNEPAFPFQTEIHHWGMKKRELIAMHLMAGLYSVNRDDYDETLCAKWAVSGADRLLEELAK